MNTPIFAARCPLKHTIQSLVRRWGVDHQISTPHYPRSNGHAEAVVKAAKRLIQKTTSCGDLDTDAYAQGLLEFRNSPRADGRSPAQVLFGHPLRSAVPAHHRAFADCWQRAADACDAKAAEQQQRTTARYDASARQHSALTMGQRLLIQDPRSGLWDRVGVITAVGRRRDYLVRLPSGRIYWRNRRYLRPQRTLISESVPAPTPGSQPLPSRSLAAGGAEETAAAVPAGRQVAPSSPPDDTGPARRGTRRRRLPDPADRPLVGPDP